MSVKTKRTTCATIDKTTKNVSFTHFIKYIFQKKKSDKTLDYKF